MPQTTETGFEARVQEILLTHGARKRGANAQWDKDIALFPARVISFIADIQPKHWLQMRILYGTKVESMFIRA